MFTVIFLSLCVNFSLLSEYVYINSSGMNCHWCQCTVQCQYKSTICVQLGDYHIATTYSSEFSRSLILVVFTDSLPNHEIN